MPAQLAPPSVVLSTDVHGALAHGAVPSTHPSSGLTKDTLDATNPAGTGPPGGPGTTLPDEAAEVVGLAAGTTIWLVEEVTDEADVDGPVRGVVFGPTAE